MEASPVESRWTYFRLVIISISAKKEQQNVFVGIIQLYGIEKNVSWVKIIQITMVTDGFAAMIHLIYVTRVT